MMDSESEDTQSITQRVAHWNHTYELGHLPTYPSQFAVFVCDYLQAGQNLIEFGCGSGRDAFFFAAQGNRVVGYDASETAIEKCRAHAAAGTRSIPSFEQLRIEGHWEGKHLAETSELIKGRLHGDRPTMVYARFFLHAITTEEQKNFLDLLRVLDTPEMMYAFEFRTLRDEGQSKIAQPHYRRFIDPVTLLEELDSRGFKVEYFVEGFGLAKYKTEDAHVARVVFKTPGTKGGVTP